jgi:endoglucanase
VDGTAELLKSLTEASGVSGHEHEIREIVRDFLSGLGDLTQDKIGSLICALPVQEGLPRVMLVGHMDEIGFMVKHITKKGFLRFLPLGGWFDQVLLGHRVIIQTHLGPVTGVIGAKPPHLLPPEERKKVVKRKDMYIDVGATSKEEVESVGIRLGDPVVPQADFTMLAGEKAYLAKAFDDRIGTALMMQVLQQLKDEKLPSNVFGVATVMEEVGLRGATTSVEAVNPDVAIILEVDIAGDVPGIKRDESDIRLSKGPTVMLYDRRMIPNLKLRDLVISIAEEYDIPMQMSVMEGGATDGGAIHLHKTGVPTVNIGVPARHIHSHGSIIHRDDYDRALRLIIELVRRLDRETVDALTG